MKERYSNNSIDLLYDSSGNKLSSAVEIKENIRVFYKGLIGTTADSILGVDVTVVRQGPRLTADAAQHLIRLVLHRKLI